MPIIYVPSGGDLQSAIDRALAGDIIELQPGATYIGTFALRYKGGVVTIRTRGPLPERRITPVDAPLLATLASGNSIPAINGFIAVQWRLEGLRFEPNREGYGAVIELVQAENITLDRILLAVPEGQQQKRGILGNGKHITLTRSHLSGIWRQGQDSQAFAAWDGSGPYTITDNYLEAASENILFGGSDASSAANIPADILIEGNEIAKPLAWKGQPRQVKNLLELKCAKRVVIRGNTFRNNWADAQSGAAILFTPRNQDGTAPFTVVEDVLFEQNTIIGVGRGFNITGHDDLEPSGQTTRIVIRNNSIETDGLPFLLHKEIGTLAIYKNTVTMPAEMPILSFDKTIMWKAGEAKREALYAVENLTFAETASPGSYIHSPTVVGYPGTPKAAEAFAAYVKQPVSLTVPIDVPTPPEPPQPPVTPVPVPVPDPTAAKLKAVLDYLAAMPNYTKVAQIIKYIKAVPK